MVHDSGSTHLFMYTVALKAMPYVTMDFERCKDSVSASIVDDIVTCDMGKLILLILESDSHVDRHINIIQYL